MSATFETAETVAAVVLFYYSAYVYPRVEIYSVLGLGRSPAYGLSELHTYLH